MANRKNIIIVVLIFLTAVLGGISILISQVLQNNQAPDESSADIINTIKGKPATTSVFDDINEAFQAGGCSALLSNDTIDFYALDNFDEINDLNVTYVNSFPTFVDCTAFLDNGEQIDMTINLYPTEQTTRIIDTTIADANTNIGTLIKSASVLFSPYYFGNAADDSTECQTNIFSRLNDFEYISLTYRNFTVSCEELDDFNTQLTFVVAMAANNIANKAKDVNETTN